MKKLSVSLSLLLLCGNLHAQVERTVSGTYPLDLDGKVSIDTYKGSISVEVWDKDEVFMEARIESENDDADEAREAVDNVDIEIDARSGSFRVGTSYDHLNRRRDRWSFGDIWGTELPSVHYTLRVPEKASLVVEDYKSSTRISGLTSDLTFETYKGDAVVKDHSGEVRLETYKGDIDVEFRGMAHASTFETYKGDIVVRLPRDAAFDVRLDLGRRADLRTDFDIKDDSRRRGDDRRFRDSVNGGGPAMRFESTKGTIRIDSY